jgi:PTH1 family peptidyl-tRNA hydrolase
MSIKLVVLLGNPGEMYARNRHNAGRLLAEHLSFSLSWQRKWKGLFATVQMPNTAVGGSQAFFLQPETFMNLSGESVAACVGFYKIAPEHILVVHDELELKLGQAALKWGGGLGGHNGLRSIKACIGTADFWRLRIGIGRPEGDKKNADISGWVLSDFDGAQKPLLDLVLGECAAAVEGALSRDPEKLLPEWGKKSFI